MTGRAHLIAALVGQDFRLQYRYGVYVAYGFVVAFYIAVFLSVGALLPTWLPGIIIFSDPAGVGFFFLGALMLLEKSENVRLAVGVTPLTPAAYFAAKCITLTTLAVVAVTLLTPLIHQKDNWPLLALTTALTSISFLGLGVIVARRFKTVTAYLIGAMIWFLPVTLPAVLALIDPMPLWAIIVPTAAQFRLILIATGYGSAGGLESVAMLLVCAITALCCAIWAVRDLRDEFGLR